MSTKSLLEYYYPQSPPELLGDLFDEMDIPDPHRPVTILRTFRGITFERDPIPARVRRAILQRDGYACRWCGNDQRLQIDHIMQVSAGGGSHPMNLRVLCAPCNRRRGNRDADRWTAIAHPIVDKCSSCTNTPSGAFMEPTVAFCTTCGMGSLADAGSAYAGIST